MLDVGRVRPYLRLERDVAVRAVDDAAGIKIPTIGCHVLDGCLVFTGEGHARKPGRHERPTTNARHTVGDRHARKSAATLERKRPDARHTRRDSHSRHTTTTVKRIRPDARHTRRDSHRC